MADPPPTYTREEMDEILKRAIERQQAKSEEIGHEDLVAAAGEVGIPREEVEAAARDLEADKAQGAQKGERAPPRNLDVTAHDLARRRLVRRFLRRAASFGVLTLFFFFLSGMQMGGWWIWPALGFGVSLSMTAIKIVFGEDEGDAGGEEKKRQQRLSRRERKRMRREERLADFERKVAIGADALVRVIDEARNAKARLEDDVRSVGKERGPRVLVTPPPGVGVRVDTREADGMERESPGATREGRRNRS